MTIPDLDRTVQRRILQAAAEVYPAPNPSPYQWHDVAEQTLIQNLIFMEQKGLIRSGLVKTTRGHTGWAGGVQLLTEGVAPLLEHEIDRADISHEARATLKKKLAQYLRSVATTEAAELAHQAILHLPDAIAKIQKWSG